MRSRRGRQHRRVLGVVSGLHDAGPLLPHHPPCSLVYQAKVGDGDARRPILRLHQQHAVDERIRDFLVRVPEDDQVHTRHLAGDARRNVLARHARGDRVIARRTAEARVHRDQHDVRAGLPSFGDSGPHFRHDVTDDEAVLEVVAIPYHRTRCGRPDDRDLGAAARDHRPGLEAARAIGAIRVGGEEWKRRLADGPVEEGHPVVELVVAHRRRVILHRIHGGHRRVRRSRGRDARGDVRQRIAL